MASSASSAHPTIKGAYCRPSWAQNLVDNAIEIPHFTHLFYAFLNPEDGNDQNNLLRRFTDILHEKSPPVKVLFSVGGYDETVTKVLSRMASERTSRAEFIRWSIDVARNLGFDGVDLDWEFPEDRTEMENFGELLKEWRLAVTDEAKKVKKPPLLLTAAVYYMTTITWKTYKPSYPVPTMSRNLDFINVMSYDYHGSGWEPNVTGALAALNDLTGRPSTRSGIDSWTRDGAGPEKLIMGMPLYGRTWKLMDPARSSGIGARANGKGPGDGEMTYADVVRFNQDRNARDVYDEATGSVYSVAGNDWISYDDPRSVRAKIEYARGCGLRGYFFWQVAGDDQYWTLSRTASESW